MCAQSVNLIFPITKSFTHISVRFVIDNYDQMQIEIAHLSLPFVFHCLNGRSLSISLRILAKIAILTDLESAPNVQQILECISV